MGDWGSSHGEYDRQPSSPQGRALQLGVVELAFELSHYAEDDPLIPLRQAHCLAGYLAWRLVAQSLDELRV